MSGFGHITRCVSLADGFAKRGYRIRFVVNGDDSIDSAMLPFPFELFNWPGNDRELVLRLENADLILIDSMQISERLTQEIQNTGIPVAFIDDDAKRKHFLSQGIIIDWTIGSEKKAHFFPQKSGVTYFLGARYAVLRDAFLTCRKNRINENIRSVMITFGGADVRNLTPKILGYLNSNYPGIHKQVVIGSGFDNEEEISRQADGSTRLVHRPNAEKMMSLMVESDIAIAAGGQTLYELARAGTPTMGILLVENAREDTRGWHETGFLEYLGWYNSPDLLTKISRAMIRMQSASVRRKMQMSAEAHLNPLGSAFLVEQILKTLNA